MKEKPEPDWAIRFQFFIHDNRLRQFLIDPYKVLRAIGVKPGQVVLDLGCGPGFFTIPAGKIVGEEGLVYALDLHPLALERVSKKAQKFGLKNIQPILARADQTSLPDQSIDLAFLFGMVHKLDDYFYEVMKELSRILKPSSILAIEKSPSVRKNQLLESLKKYGFELENSWKGILIFKGSF